MGADVTLRDKVLTGHKFAFTPVAKGTTIVKYGAPIGIATQDIAPGEPMHLHNIASDYGHDAFLVEYPLFTHYVTDFLDRVVAAG